MFPCRIKYWVKEVAFPIAIQDYNTIHRPAICRNIEVPVAIKIGCNNAVRMRLDLNCHGRARCRDKLSLSIAQQNGEIFSFMISQSDI